MKHRNFFYTCNFDNGIAYVKAVSKQAAIQQLKRAARNNNYSYQLNTIKRISRRDYDEAHES